MPLFSQMEMPETIQSDDVQTARCVKLWRAVIDEAILDAANTGETVWIEGRTRNFFDVCDLAMLEPEWVRQQIKKYIDAKIAERSGTMVDSVGRGESGTSA